MTQDDIPTDLLAAVLDTLMPANGDYPRGGEPRIVVACIADAQINGNRNVLAEVLRSCPKNFQALDAPGRERALRALERNHSQALAAVVHHLYNVYYIDASVRAALETEIGYPARPPHYEGYELESFDESLLKKQRARPAFWRPDINK